MDKLNAEFMAGPEEFLNQHPVGFKSNSPLPDLWSEEEAPVDYFDLSYAASGGGVELELFASRGKAKGRYSNKIKAYWLPHFKNETTKIELGDRAPFFFTDELTGCRIQIGGESTTPTVLHISGFSGSTRAWREQQAQEHLKASFKGSRRYSKHEEDLGYPSVAFVCGYWDDARERWRILAQEKRYANKELTVENLRYLQWTSQVRRRKQ